MFATLFQRVCVVLIVIAAEAPAGNHKPIDEGPDASRGWRKLNADERQGPCKTIQAVLRPESSPSEEELGSLSPRWSSVSVSLGYLASALQVKRE